MDNSLVPRICFGVKRAALPAIVVLALPLMVLAQTPAPAACQVINTINNISNVLGYAVGVVAVLIIMYAAFMFLTQSGSVDGVAKARTLLIYALVAIAVALVAFNAAPIVESVIGGEIQECPE